MWTQPALHLQMAEDGPEANLPVLLKQIQSSPQHQMHNLLPPRDGNRARLSDLLTSSDAAMAAHAQAWLLQLFITAAQRQQQEAPGGLQGFTQCRSQLPAYTGRSVTGMVAMWKLWQKRAATIQVLMVRRQMACCHSRQMPQPAPTALRRSRSWRTCCATCCAIHMRAWIQLAGESAVRAACIIRR